jgi:hypothetical protein
MAMLSKNMLHESPAFDFDFISAPYTKLFVSREDGIIVCLLYERSMGTFAWSRITTNGEIKSVATLPGQSGYDDVYLIVKRGEKFYLEILEERENVYLDSYERLRPLNNSNIPNYTGDAVVYDETENKLYKHPQIGAPIPGHIMWIGYPYESRMRSMPVLANDQMKQNIIKTLNVRFNGSSMPRVKSLPNNREEDLSASSRAEPYDGIVQIPFPGGYDRDAFFEIIHSKPTPCRVLAINAEVN